MNRLYVDSSVIVALLLNEETSRGCARLLEQTDVRVSSCLLEAEIYATAAREQIDLRRAEQFIETVSCVIPDRSLKKEYFRIFRSGFCRGADACHIATALFLDPKREDLLFFTLDREQAKVAQAVGFQLVSLSHA